jgi:hypothetical protein
LIQAARSQTTVVIEEAVPAVSGPE